MSLDMILEMEGDNPDWEACLAAARRVGLSEIDEKNGLLNDGLFARSGAYFKRSAIGFGPEGKLNPIRAEGYHGCNFLTRYRMVFRINTGLYDESVQDIKYFLIHLSRISKMKFVLSFQFEGIYALRCANGLEWFWDEPRDENWRPR